MQSFPSALVFLTKKRTIMNLNCAILHDDEAVVRKLETYIGKIPFLSLCGVYSDPLDALRGYYEKIAEVFFVGISSARTGGIGGMDFCRLLSSPTRVIFVADSERYAAECFRLDALDYLTGSIDFSTFFQSVSKAARWFSLQQGGSAVTVPGVTVAPPGCSSRVIYIRSDNRIMRLELEQINYIEGLGDYVKIYCRGMLKPILSLCSMKYMEEKLPADEFIRVHRSFIVRKEGIDAIGRSTVVIEKKDLPIGDAYRERVKGYVSGLAVL